ncbi:tetraacyldisaccharide 4'-kinase [Winogradskyella echinorum]|uniref:Tetraacyldisaccharide 4'-kinase n=1 Tax=Winogradskyella echinorum TaxID=538189 RepID=A0ABR6XX84_9FLAO|nr:tetraacyldisaccharide 4'-kinase [Winogradskyella echinorum]MBC3845085.1 tetraacyldisaccharide 4'-kinase [Winogradskyella echinorum]MBC5749433.1 tetraacyldisaccharide 4'-kinase [Winogradskyella echinorum]
MKFIRIILFPVVPIYYLVTWLRNLLYDKGIKSSKSYNFPIICVGNLSTGGTGKTPMIEYLIRLLKNEKSIATLSRGYKRKTDGFVFADENANADTIGDEPFQFYNKFKNEIKVAVDSNRQNGIEQLRSMAEPPEVILLDDAYQHRKVRAGFNILLTAYNNLYYKDIVLPAGNLREPRSGAKRADVIVVTKCPKNISEQEKKSIIARLKIQKHQLVCFSYIDYADIVISANDSISLESLPNFTLVTGIANAQPLVEFLLEKALKFDHLEYGDHYNFKATDIEKLKSKELIITTEKDYMRLSNDGSLKDKLYYLPIEIKLDRPELFNTTVKSFVS